MLSGTSSATCRLVETCPARRSARCGGKRLACGHNRVDGLLAWGCGLAGQRVNGPAAALPDQCARPAHASFLCRARC